jgi:endonuclease/exonuclease/phosphatase (EEP) superfamily protein YafD
MARTVVFLLAWFVFLIAAVALTARFAPVVNHALLALAALSPYLIVGSGLLVLPILLTQWRWAAVPTLVIVAVTAALNAPLFVGRSAAQGIPIRVLTANLREGGADPTALAALARDHVDLLVAQELTPGLARQLSELEPEFPYRALDPAPFAGGVGIWSRYPIVQSSRNAGYKLGMVSASVRVPGAANDVVVLAAHLVGPWPQAIDDWRRELAKFPETLSATAGTAPGAVIVAGDLNATNDMQPLRELLRDGFANAAEQSAAGFVRTFPADESAPPLIGIDHILTYKCSASDLRTVRVPGSDHLGVAATISVPG